MVSFAPKIKHTIAPIRRKMTSLLLYSDLEPAVYTANVSFSETYLLTAAAWVIPNSMYVVACNFTVLSKTQTVKIPKNS